MSDTSTSALTLFDAIAIGLLAEWVTKGRRVKWAVDGDVRRLATGTMRGFVRGSDDFTFIGHADDIRDAYIWITTSWEWSISVRQALQLMGDGLMVEDK